MVFSLRYAKVEKKKKGKEMKGKKKRLLNKKTQHVFQEDLMTGGWENNVAGITTCLPWSCLGISYWQVILLIPP